MKSRIEENVLNRIVRAGFPEPDREHVFAKPRKWRFDFCWPLRKLAVECEGGVFIRGRHTRGTGFINDCQKYNRAQLLGWKVLRYTTANLDEIIPDLIEAFKEVR